MIHSKGVGHPSTILKWFLNIGILVSKHSKTWSLQYNRSQTDIEVCSTYSVIIMCMQLRCKQFVVHRLNHRR